MKIFFLWCGIFFYFICDIATFIYLIKNDMHDFNFWNWIVIIPIDIFLSQIWPLYWGILHWI